MNIASYNKIKWFSGYMLLSALLCLFCYGVYQTWLLVHPVKPNAVAVQEINPVAEQSVDLTVLTRVPFLGIAAAEEQEVVQKRHLALQLQGIFWSPDAEQTHAILQTEMEKAKLYAMGDTVLPGVTITKILRDRILLSRNGHNETLFLKPET